MKLMAKRSNFARVEKDYYPTIDLRAGKRLSDHIYSGRKIFYGEPCYGKGHLERNLIEANSSFVCKIKGDIEDGKDLFTWNNNDVLECQLIITNPPWTRSILHPAIEHLCALKDTWLLFDSSWAYTKQAKSYIDKFCTEILVVGRLKWIEGTNMSGKDDCSWYKFSSTKNKQTEFYV